MQLPIEFEPGLTERFEKFEDLVAASIYGSKAGVDGVAAACDLQPSVLSKMLSGYENRRPPLEKLPTILKTTGDLRPLHWLIEKFLRDPDERRQVMIDQLAKLAVEAQALVTELRGVEHEPRARGQLRGIR